MSADRPAVPTIALRPVSDADIPHFFNHQLDPVANYMAAFTPDDPGDWEAFLARWTMNRANESNINRTILRGDEVAGYIVCYEELGRPEVSYWLDRRHWGSGVATQALRLFLAQLPERPIYARVATDNHASLRVLQKCGFVIIGQDRGFANARQTEVDEFILRLDVT